MNDSFSSLPRYPKSSPDELPASRKHGNGFWVGFVFLGVGLVLLGGLAALTSLLPEWWLLWLVPELQPFLLGWLGVWGLVLFLVFVFAWQRSE